MTEHDELGLFADRLGSDRYRRLVANLDASLDASSAAGVPPVNTPFVKHSATQERAAVRLLGASEFFRTLVERQIDWLEREAD